MLTTAFLVFYFFSFFLLLELFSFLLVYFFFLSFLPILDFILLGFNHLHRSATYFDSEPSFSSSSLLSLPSPLYPHFSFIFFARTFIPLHQKLTNSHCAPRFLSADTLSFLCVVYSNQFPVYCPTSFHGYLSTCMDLYFLCFHSIFFFLSSSLLSLVALNINVCNLLSLPIDGQ